MTFSGLERKLLVVHRLGVKLGEGVSRSGKRGVHGPIYLVEAGGDRFPLLGHHGGSIRYSPVTEASDSGVLPDCSSPSQ